jgi:hypothetical protein
LLAIAALISGGWLSPQARTLAAQPATAAPQAYRIRLAYFVPRDRQPVANYAQKIRVVMAMVATLYEQDLKAKGYATGGLRYEGEAGAPQVQLVRVEQAAAYYNNAPAYDANEQWRRLLPEIRTNVADPRRQVIVVFAETYDEGPSDRLWPGVLARGAYNTADGGLAVFSAHILKDEFCATTVERLLPLLSDRTPVTGRRALGHRMNSPRCEFVEDGIGAVAHELGHAIGLPHDRRQDDVDIMGNGFRNLRWNFGQPSAKRVRFSDENARLLMSSRYLAGDLRLADNRPPQVAVKILVSENGERTIDVTASDDTGLRAYVIVDGAGESVASGGKLSGRSQQFQYRLPAAQKPGGVKVIVADDGGNQTRRRLPAVNQKP